MAAPIYASLCLTRMILDTWSEGQRARPIAWVKSVAKQHSFPSFPTGAFAILHDCLIIGAGPAGLTAATYLARFRRSVAVVDAGFSRARWIPASHNCPGFPFGVAGNELLDRFRTQAETYGVSIVEAKIERLSKNDDGFSASDGRTNWHAKTVILATGVVDRLPKGEGVEEAIEAGVVRLCAVCDGYEAKDEIIGVYGPAPVAIGHAEFLRTFSKHVVLIESCPAITEDMALRERAQVGGIQWYPSGSKLSITNTGCQVSFDDRSQHLDTVYPVLGADAQSTLAAILGAATDNAADLRVDEGMQTNVPGLYAIGDVVEGLNQISVAVGQAAVAACAIHSFLPRNPK